MLQFINMVLQLLICLIIIVHNEIKAASHDMEYVTSFTKEPAFVFILPQVLQYNGCNEVCLTLHNIDLPVNATIKMKGNKASYNLTERTIQKGN